MADDRPFAFAGLWEAWRPESGPPVMTCCILTTAANALVKPVHDRVPVIFDPPHYAAWIDRAVQEPAELAADAASVRRRPYAGLPGRAVGEQPEE
jgi:putative SOS response-associated peptidase YedK